MQMNGEISFDLSGKVAVVTGAGKGLGRAFCEAMAEFGANVACVDFDQNNLEETAQLLERYGKRVITVKSDVSIPDEVKNMVHETVARLGTVDVLVNNAGITSFPAKISETPVEDWNRIIGTNLTGVFLCMRAVLPVMANQKRGSIINISSVGAFGGSNPEVAPAAYGAAKAGVINLTKFGAVEYAADGIRVNSIAPGIHETGFGKPSDSDLIEEQRKNFEEFLSKRVPMKRVGQPYEVKGLAVFLASDASSYITGQVFIQDGGQLAQI